MASVTHAAHLALVELEDDIARSLRESEVTKQPSIRLLGSQPQVSWEMRPQLLEFLAQAQAALQLLPDTFALAVSILDRYMSRRIVYTKHYQLLGCVCLWLAAKTIDDKHRVPTASTLVYLCADTYGESMFAEMELHVLSTLEWNLLAPTAQDFIDLCVAEVARQLGSDSFGTEQYGTVRSMARYLCECSLFSKDIVSMKRSTVAASAVALSTFVLDTLEMRRWPSVYPESCSKECFDALVALIANPPYECTARYSGEDEHCASALFSEFLSAMEAAKHYNDAAGLHQPPSLHSSGLTHFSKYANEPCTPIRSREVSFGTMTPTDEELCSPEGSTRSPNTYFVPLTPDGMYDFSAASSLVGLPEQK